MSQTNKEEKKVEGNTTTNSPELTGATAKPAEIKVEEKKAEETKEEKVAPAKAPKALRFISNDGKKMSAAINEQTWQGAVIEVEGDYAAEVKQLLRKGGYHFDTEEV